MHPRSAHDVAPIESITLAHPELPPELDGLVVLHITDLHRRRAISSEGAEWSMVLRAIASASADLAVLTGDWCDAPGQERAAAEALSDLSGACRVPLGRFGVFGNHDNAELRRLLREFHHASQSQDESIQWIGGHSVEPRPGLRLIGFDFPEDPVGTLLQLGLSREGLLAPFTLALCHTPVIAQGAMLGLPILFAGHTHGGQVRLPLRSLRRAPALGSLIGRGLDSTVGDLLAPHTSSDLPGRLASGVSAFGGTLCCVSRGLGDSVAELARAGCPRQVARYTLVRGPLAAWPTDAGRQHARPVDVGADTLDQSAAVSTGALPRAIRVW